MKKIISLLIIVVLLSSVIPFGQLYAHAETLEHEDNGTLNTANLLELKPDPQNKTITSAVINGSLLTGSDEDYYKVDLAAPGKLKIDINVNQQARYKVSLLTKDGTPIESWNTRFIESKTLITMIDIGLAKGTYFIKISMHEMYNENTPYTVKVGYTPSSTTEHEVNNTIANANKISFNTQVTATFSHTKDSDYYQLTVPKDMTLSILTTRPLETTYLLKFFNQDETVLKSHYSEPGSDQLLRYFVDVKVKAGTYYLKLSPELLGVPTFERYSFKIIEKDTIAPGIPKINQITDKSTTISGTAEANSSIYIKINYSKTSYWKYKAGAADKYGKFKFPISKLRAGTVVNISAKDSTGNEGKSVTVKVKDVTAPSLPTINKLSCKSKYLTGKTEPYAKVKIKIGSKTLITGKADSKGKFKIKVGYQKRKTKLCVYGTDASGNISKAKVVVVK
ncbi:Ig-like domain-containing protein [Bacillus suaedaesalsae]|uniref:Bacterial Ig domain-containing protein n=1 Tax=Bacillus suaedaesalsae TaxID=2810349 RepID=A0ABS2DKU2_9BACI|nr:Ig-like domain-containing protein [Bacillus suaedaesalsae]MBM6619114.1 hypothetical protein [Bacillus suaedaesalsae]